MMNPAEKYINYISAQKRYSARTKEIYSSVLERFYRFSLDDDALVLPDVDNDAVREHLTPASIRNYQVHLIECGDSPRTVNLHLSVLSGYCRYLIRQGVLSSNPVSLTVRPKQSRRLPSFFKAGAMEKYLGCDNALNRRDFELALSTVEEKKDTYWLCLKRAVVCTLYATGMRRAELIGLRRSDVDFSREKIRVLGKGDKMREIPLVPMLVREISLYLQAVERLVCTDGSNVTDRLFVTWSGAPLYPVLVERAVKEEFGPLGNDFAGKKSPHVLRHSLATGLLEEGADLNSIKEVLGHANLAATQVYTHSNIKALKTIYEKAHPRATVEDGKGNDR